MSASARTRTRPANLLYDVDEWPPPARLLLLGVQYAVFDAIYLVLVAIILGHTGASAATRVSAMGIACVAAAVALILQVLPRGPVGSGYLAPPVFSATYLGPSVLAAELGGIPLVCGMTLFAGLVEVLIGVAFRRLRIIMTPVLSGLTVFVVGLQLGIVGIGETLDVVGERLPGYQPHVAVAFGTLAIAVGLSIWGRGTWRLIGTMVGLAAGMLGAAAIGLLRPASLAAVGHAGWLALPHPIASLTFNFALAPAFIAAAVAAAMRTAGVVTTCQRLNDAAWKRPNLGNIRKGVLADGLGTLISGALGAPGMSTAPSLVGVSSVSGATSRAIGFAAAILLLIVALSPKLASFVLVVPHEVAGAILVYTSSFMIAGGMGIMLSRGSDTRTVYVIGIATLFALSHKIYPGYYNDLPQALHSISGSSLALGLAAAIILTLLFRIGARQSLRITFGSGAEESPDATLDAVRAKGEEWKIEAEVWQSALGQVAELLRYIRRTSERPLAGCLRIRHDSQELGIDILYAGNRLAPLPDPGLAQNPRQAEVIDNEESAAIVGLKDFTRGLMADAKGVHVRGDQVRVRLRYDL